MTVYDYYPGCSLKGTGKAFEESMLAVFGALGIAAEEMDDWNCCGATAYMAIDEGQAFALAARNVAIAERDGRDLIAPCAACWLVLTKTVHHLEEHPEMRSLVNDALGGGGNGSGLAVTGAARVKHPLDVLAHDFGVEAFAEAVTNPLEGLKVAPYYGCQLVRPYAEFDEQHNPVTMDNLLAAAGCEVIDYPLKTRCCGASQMMTMPDVGIDLVQYLLADAKARGADVVAVACPMCQFNLEGYQRKASKKAGRDLTMPILYFTQLLGLALGLPAKQLGLGRSFVKVEPVLAGRRADAS